jgi:hypothetical protein
LLVSVVWAGEKPLALVLRLVGAGNKTHEIGGEGLESRGDLTMASNVTFEGGFGLCTTTSPLRPVCRGCIISGALLTVPIATVQAA